MHKDAGNPEGGKRLSISDRSNRSKKFSGSAATGQDTSIKSAAGQGCFRGGGKERNMSACMQLGSKCWLVVK